MSIEKEVKMEHEEYIGYGSEGYTVVNHQGQIVVTLRAGDTLELFIGTGWQRVCVESGGYKGWYYMTADGQPARFALAMQIRGYQPCASLKAAPESEHIQGQERAHAHRPVHRGKRVHCSHRHEIAAFVETLPSGVQVLHPVQRSQRRKEHLA